MFTVNSLSKTDTVGTGSHCPSYRELSYSKMTEKRQGRYQQRPSRES